jgi:MFS family permease
MNNLVATLPKSLRSTGLGVAFTGFHSGWYLPPIAFWHTVLVTEVLSYNTGSGNLQWHAGNLLGLAISPLILTKFGWRGLFCIFGIFGGPLLAFWVAAVPAKLATGLTHPDLMPLLASEAMLTVKV